MSESDFTPPDAEYFHQAMTLIRQLLSDGLFTSQTIRCESLLQQAAYSQDLPVCLEYDTINDKRLQDGKKKLSTSTFAREISNANTGLLQPASWLLGLEERLCFMDGSHKRQRFVLKCKPYRPSFLKTMDAGPGGNRTAAKHWLRECGAVDGSSQRPAAPGILPDSSPDGIEAAVTSLSLSGVGGTEDTLGIETRPRLTPSDELCHVSILECVLGDPDDTDRVRLHRACHRLIRHYQGTPYIASDGRVTGTFIDRHDPTPSVYLALQTALHIHRRTDRWAAPITFLIHCCNATRVWLEEETESKVKFPDADRQRIDDACRALRTCFSERASAQGNGAAGGIYATADARRAALDHFEFSAAAPALAEGLSRVVRYRWTRSLFDPSQTGVLQLIGRDEELGILERAWSAALDGEPQWVELRGPTGSGRTRLMLELARRMRLRPKQRRLIVLECSELQSRSPFHAVTRALRDAFGFLRLHTTDSIDSQIDSLAQFLELKHEQIRSVLRYLLTDLPAKTDEAGDPLGVPKIGAKQIIDVVSDVVAAMAERQPLLVLIKDVQWLDASSRQIVELVLHRVKAAAMGERLASDGAKRRTYRLMIISSRSPLSGEQAPDEGPDLQTVQLKPLAEADARELVKRASEKHNIPLTHKAIRQIVNHANGVPALLRGLAGPTDEGRWRTRFVAEALADDATRMVAQHASVLGDEFDLSVLARMLGDAPIDADVAVARLCEAQILRRMDDQGTLLHFTHASLREEIVNSIAPYDRENLHRKAAEALRDTETPLLSRVGVPAVIAEHYSLAGDHARDSAAQAWIEAAEDARCRGAPREVDRAIAKAEICLARLPEGPQLDRLQLCAIKSKTQAALLRGDWAEASQALDLARSVVNQGDGRRNQFEWEGKAWLDHYLRGELEQAYRLARNRLTWTTQIAEPTKDDHVAQFCVTRDLASTALVMGRVQEALALHMSAIESARRLSWQPGSDSKPAYLDYDPLLSTLCRGAVTLWFSGHPAQADDWDREAIIIAERCCDSNDRVTANQYSALLALLNRKYDLAASRGVRASESIPVDPPHFRQRVAGVLGAVAKAYKAGDRRLLLELVQRMDAWQRENVALLEPFLRAHVAEAMDRQGMHKEALAQTEAATAVIKANGERIYASEVSRIEGELQAQLGRPARALRKLDDAADIATGIGSPPLLLRALVSQVRLLMETGRDAKRLRTVKKRLRVALGYFPEPQASGECNHARELLGVR